MSKLEKKRLRYFKKYELTAWCEIHKRGSEAVVDWIIPEHLTPKYTKKQLTSIFEKRYPRLIRVSEPLEPLLIPLNLPVPLNLPQYEYEELIEDFESEEEYLEKFFESEDDFIF